MSSRTVFFVSDRTGITVETLGHSLLTQFPNLPFKQVTLPFIDSADKAHRAVEQINQATREAGAPAVVFSTLIEPEVRGIVAASDAVFFDFIDTYIEPLERAFGAASTHTVGRSHGMTDRALYGVRMEAVNFALSTDDGIVTKSYDIADVVITGVSRSGKTPTCLYLAMQFGLRAANYPLTEDDLDDARLPAALVPHRARVYGLTIQPERLQQIRHERRPDSRYSSLKQCQVEVEQAEALYRAQGIPYVDTTTMSVEEIAATILHNMKLQRRLY
jgi:hypothetical protein